MNKRKLSLIILIITTVIVLAFSPFYSHAFSLNILGGRNYFVTYCTCSWGIMITVGPPRPGNFIFSPILGSTLYKYFQIFSAGPWVLGNARGYGTCWVGAYPDCAYVGGGPVIRLIGTSLY